MTREQTVDLVSRLAREAGAPAPRGMSFAAALPAALAPALLAALVLVAMAAGLRPDLPAALGIVLFKLMAMLLLAGGALALVRGAATPGAALRPALALAPALLFLAGGVALDDSTVPLTGIHPPLSAVSCVATIVLAALPALALVLTALRRGIPTRLRRAGFCAGLLAGAISALAYSLACLNDGAAFVALWYPTSALIVALLGAAAGSKALAW